MTLDNSVVRSAIPRLYIIPSTHYYIAVAVSLVTGLGFPGCRRRRRRRVEIQLTENVPPLKASGSKLRH